MIGFSDDDLTDTTDNTRMHLEQKVAATFTQTAIDAAPYETTKLLPAVSTTIEDVLGQRSIVRHDGGNFLVDGFVVGKRVQISGVAGYFTVVGMFDDDVDGKFERIALDAGRRRALPAADLVVARTRNPLGRSDRHGRRRSGRADRADHDRRWGLRRLRHPDRRAELGRLRLHGGPAGPDPGPRRFVAPAPDREAPTWQRCVLRLERGLALPTIAIAETRMVYWPGPHGGLTVVHGGGNSQLKINFPLDTTGSVDGVTATVSRLRRQLVVRQRVQHR